MKRNSGAMGAFGVLVGLAFIVGPIVFGQFIEGVSQIILMAFGVLLLLLGMIIVIITKLYQKATPYQAFIRTGMGGKKIITDGGALVIPVVHNLSRVSLETMRLDVDRVGEEALITEIN